MPDSLLQILKVCLLAAVGLFFLRVLRAVWAELKPPVPAPPHPEQAARSTGPAPGTAPDLHLRVVDPPESKGKIFPVAREMTVGRAPGCGVALTDATVSQLHARIFRGDDGRLWVEDLGSTNGTFVNRKKVSAPSAVRRGDRIQVGSTVLEVTR